MKLLQVHICAHCFRNIHIFLFKYCASHQIKCVFKYDINKILNQNSHSFIFEGIYRTVDHLANSYQVLDVLLLVCKM